MYLYHFRTSSWEKEMGNHLVFFTLTTRTEEPSMGVSPWGLHRVGDTTEARKTSLSLQQNISNLYTLLLIYLLESLEALSLFIIIHYFRIQTYTMSRKIRTKSIPKTFTVIHIKFSPVAYVHISSFNSCLFQI